MNNIINHCVISSRIRLARNIRTLPFPSRITEKQALDDVIIPLEKILKKQEMQFFLMKNILPINRLMLIEKHLISKDLAANSNIGGLVLSDDQSISIMVNEEDHFREQCILKGFKLEKAWEKLNNIDALIMENLDIAYDSKLGFLTACPTNLGTAMRASIMLFLPGLSISGGINDVIKAVADLGLVVRGGFGESSNADGYFYQLSNRSSFGRSEQEIIENINDAVLKICELEQLSRQELWRKNTDKVRNQIMRALGVLKSCYSITHKEFLELYAMVKLGIGLGVVNIKNLEVFDDLLEQCASGALQVMNKAVLPEEQINVKRAELLVQTFKHI